MKQLTVALVVDHFEEVAIDWLTKEKPLEWCRS